MAFIPYVTENVLGGERTYDVYSRLLKDRIVFIEGEINDPLADAIVAQLIFLEADAPKKDINVYINSPGGSVTAGLAIYDTMKYISSRVRTICIGQAASMAASLLAGGEKGERYILPSARVMIHQPMGGAKGQASDMVIQARELSRIKKLITDNLASDCGKTSSEVAQDIERDHFMTAEEAVKYGIVDAIMRKKQ